MEPLNVYDYEQLARTRMNAAAWGFYQGGSDDEITLKANCSAYQRIRLRPRVLVDVSDCNAETTIMGIPVQMPIMVAPTALHRLAHPEGELATAQAAGTAGALMVVSTGSSYSLEEIASVATGPLWFQLYIYRDLSVTVKLLKRAKAAGYRAIVLTVDSPRVGRRERDLRNNFCLPSHVQMANFADEAWKGGLRGERAPITWETLHWLQSETSLPLILKGILTAEDAHMAVEHGVAGIIVSNHGGRQLDGAVTSIEALPEIVDAVAGRCAVYVDGGIRRGTDVLKALGLGASAVLIGRPILWGLAANGAEGVRHVLYLLREELELDMALAGLRTLTCIDRSLIKMARNN
jgi:4-hydroxymandelate oxidase